MDRSQAKEGKIELTASCDGLLKVDNRGLKAVNGFGQMMIATRHGNFAVKKGDKLAGTRISPLIIEEEKMEAATNVFNGRVSDDMTGFLMIIIKKGRFKEFDGIFTYIISNIKRQLGIGALHVTSATPLSQEQKDKILKKVINSSEYKKLEVTYETDKDIIGGLILCMDDRIVDNSIRTKLDSMGRYLSQIQL